MAGRENAEVRLRRGNRRLGLRKGTLGRVLEDYGGALVVRWDGEGQNANGMFMYEHEVEFTGQVRKSDSVERKGPELQERGEGGVRW